MLHHFLRSEVVIELGPDAAPHLRWGRSTLPTLLDVEPLRDAAVAAGLDDGALFANFSSRTPLEQSDGNWTGLAARLGPTVCESSEVRRAAAFRQYILPSTEGAPSTRGSAWRNWRGILTWATARRCLHRVLPMPTLTLESLLWDLVSLDCTYPMIKGYLDCIQARHRRFRQASPICGALSYSRLSMGLP